ncbi:hypothetical protein PSEUDO8AS_90180 [Pseudomonas sp. 8AS]|nr:hypothetical protein PSEUDO8AS_90180 [Pseudomonas sp. 8AS]
MSTHLPGGHEARPSHAWPVAIHGLQLPVGIRPAYPMRGMTRPDTRAQIPRACRAALA